jgi:Endonuclease NucS
VFPPLIQPEKFCVLCVSFLLLAMIEKVEKLANLVRSKILGGKILSANLSDKHNPHFAKILVQTYTNKRIAVTTELQTETAENLLTTSLLWFCELGKLKTKSAESIWIVSNQSAKLSKICTALSFDWQKKIRIFDCALIEKSFEFADVKKIKPAKISTGKIAEKIIELSPAEIQINGANLTFKGLPFAKIKGEKCRFGVENQTESLTEKNRQNLLQLIENIRLYRTYNSPNKHHIFYKLLPEAWLESILRNDISQLDANLILSPIHNQFRVSAEQIDLLAIRKDGRIVIIELKVSSNSEHLFQAVDYWQELEKQRLAGNLKGVFGDLEIADSPCLVYLVAPRSSFHKEFDFLASTISNEIELYRFDINENWRKNVRVLSGQQIANTG